MPYSSLDNLGLAEGLTQVKPPAAVPLNIPLVLPKSEPGKQQPETAAQLQRKIEDGERNRLLFEEQRKQAEARELEILKREQAQRDYLRNKVNSVYENNPPPRPATEKVWNKYTGTYQEVPLGYSSSTSSASTPPSSAAPPASPRNSGSGLGMNAQDSPATGAPRTATAPVDVMSSPPPSSPVSAAEINAVQSLARNAATGGAIAVVGDFTAGVMMGRPVGDAAGHAVFTGVGATVGTVLGTSAGTVLGPIGAYVGGAVGGFIGGGVGGYLYDQLFPRPAQLPASNYEAPPPFTGGQGDSVAYVPYLTIRVKGGYSGEEIFDIEYNFPAVFGPIGGFRAVVVPGYAYRGVEACRIEALCRGVYQGQTSRPGTTTWLNVGGEPYFGRVISIVSSRVVRVDGLPDTSGNPPSPPIQITNRTYTQINNQITYTTPRAEPAARQTPAPAAYAPSSLASKENGTARGDSPNWVSHGGLSGTLHPNTIPLPGAFPSIEPITSPNTTQTSPLGGTTGVQADGTIIFTSPSTKNLDQPLPGLTNSNSLDPSFTSANKTTVGPQPYPSRGPQTAKPGQEPDATKPYSTVAPEPTKQSTTENVTKTDLDQFKLDLEKLLLGGTILAGLTPAIQTIGDKVTQAAQQTTPEAITEASKQGCCDAFAPTGCNADIRENAQKAAEKANDNNSILKAIRDLLNLTLNGFNSVLLEQVWATTKTINSKLGEAVPGGIGGFLQTAFKATRLDKIINALTLITSLHNAAMLSRNLASTLGDVTSQALAVIGLKDENDSPLDLNAEIGKQVDNLFSTLLGQEAWTGVKTNWNKANTIIATTTQITSTVRSLWDSSREVLEWTAENTGKIGNALKKFRVVGENAYKYMPEQVTHTNAWALKIQRFRDKTDSLDDAASSLSSVLGEVQSIQSEFKELNEQKEAFDKNLKDLTPKSREENKPVADAVREASVASIAPANAADVFRGQGESTNA